MFEFEDYKFETLGYVKIPKVNISEKDLKELGLAAGCSSEDYLKKLLNKKYTDKVNAGLVPKDQTELYKARLQFEMSEISKLQFIDYFLLIYDICRFAKESGILQSPGRGSAAGSLVLYTLDVTKVDPIKYDLLFERFISAARTELKEINGQNYIASASLPDVDIDSMASRKHEINEYLNKSFGGRTIAISNLSTFQSKVLLKEVLKTFKGFSEEETKHVSSLIESKFGKVDSIKESLENNLEFKKWANDHEDVINVCLSLAQLIKNKSVHASAILVSEHVVMESLPCELTSKKEIVCGYDKYSAEELGIKVDNLGLKNLDIIDECFQVLKISEKDIDINDPEIYSFLNNSQDFYGIFQAEDGLGKQTLRKIKPSNVNDIAVSIALGRPGSARFINEFAELKNGGKKRDIPDKLKEILGPTHGFIIFQEIIMKLSQKMADFSPKDADGLRKGIGKKIKTKVMAYKDKFIENSLKNGYKEDFVLDTWQTFEDSADYNFNRSHAVSYGLLTTYTAYLKAKYPTVFFTACLNAAKHEAKPLEEISKVRGELNNFGIKILPPDLFRSDINFRIDGDNIRFPISNIKGLHEKTLEKVYGLRKECSNKLEFFHLVKELKIPISGISGLIMAGALDNIITTKRSTLMAEIALWWLLKGKGEWTKALEVGKDYNYNLFDIVKAFPKMVNEKGKPFMKESRLETIRKHFQPHMDIYNQNRKNEDLTIFMFETHLLGFAFSKSLYDIYRTKCQDLVTMSEASGALPDERVKVIGIVKEVYKGTSKNDNDYLRIRVAGHDGEVTAMLFNTKRNKKILEHTEINGRIAEENDVVIVNGSKKDGNTIFADNVAIQECTVFKKVSELKG